MDGIPSVADPTTTPPPRPVLRDAARPERGPVPEEGPLLAWLTAELCTAGGLGAAAARRAALRLLAERLAFITTHPQ